MAIHYCMFCDRPRIIDPCTCDKPFGNMLPLGWRCPVCGRGLAPHVSECPCVFDELPLKSIPKSTSTVKVRFRNAGRGEPIIRDE
jgi:hypothetical protein